MAQQIAETQLPQRFRDVVDAQVSIYGNPVSVDQKTKIPPTQDIPLDNPNKWFRIPDVICVFVDMVGSTKLSASMARAGLGSAYQLFTGTAIRLFDAFDAPYIDIKGDGVFALFNDAQAHTAFAAAVSFKTFAKEVFTPRIKKRTEVDVGCHIGIDQKNVFVRRMGLRRVEGRTDKQNEVWAGKPVNMAAKLCSLAKDGELYVSDRYHRRIATDERVTLSCGCEGGKYTGKRVPLWAEIDLDQDERFDFDRAFRLGSVWCETHGSEFCEAVIALDSA